ncbi:MAG TPA: ABC transporter ATP-binding protein [Gemmatimonadaceae bacterium]
MDSRTIEVRDLVKQYGDFVAVRGLSFSVAPGEVLGLVGPNGAGKTSTLHSLCGIIRPTSGEIRVDGHDIVADPVPAKRALAFVPDEPQLFEYLTVDDHLRFVARLYGVADAAERIEPLLQELELADKRTALPAELSRGMRQKLAIACAFLHQPKALLLDEPLTGLDPLGIRRMKAAILRRAHAGTAVILSSHLLHLVEELCTRILIIQNGQCMVLGSIAEIVASRPQLAGRGLEELFLAITGQDTPDASGAGIAGQ